MSEESWRAEQKARAEAAIKAGHRVFRVTGLIDIDVLCLAKDEEEAEAIGKKVWLQDLLDCGVEPEQLHACEVERRRDIKNHGDLDEHYPYGADESDSPSCTTDAYLTAQGVE